MGKLTTCKTCQKEIANSARTCPGCGAKQSSGTGWVVAIGVGIVIAVGAAGASDKRDEREQQKQEVATASAIDVTAAQLFNDYETNEVSADAKYRDQVLRVVGQVVRVRKNMITDAPIVELQTPNEFESVDAEFANAGTAASLEPGRVVRIRCRGKGKLIGPQLADCVLD